MKAKDLKIGDYFSLTNRKNAKLFCVRPQTRQDKPQPHWAIDIGPEVNHGKLLIVVNDCRQMMFDPEEEVYDQNVGSYEVEGKMYKYDRRVVDAQEKYDSTLH